MITESELRSLQNKKRELEKLVQERQKAEIMKQRALRNEYKLKLEKQKLQKEIDVLKRRAAGKSTLKEKLATPQAKKRIAKGKSVLKTVNKYLRRFAEVD